MRNDFYVDLHCHPTLKSFNSGHPEPAKNIWEKIEHNCADNALTRLFRRKSSQVAKESQTNLYTLAEGGVRVAMIALYPFEKGFLKFRKVPELIFGDGNVNDVLENITGAALERINALQAQENHYFFDLVKEYEYVRNGQGDSPNKQYRYKVVNNYKELEQTLKEPNSIALILSIEGGHALGVGNPVTEKWSHEQLKEEITENVKAIKSWDQVPFSINIAHHFWNQLCGHAPSIVYPFNKLVNQDKGINEGITPLGWHALRELLGRHNGKRIYIDTKHMSIQARKEYYSFVGNYNFLNPNDKIPVISSHTGVNAYPDMDASVTVNDHNRKSKNTYLHKRSINISDEEIRIIHESEGIIGIMLDKGNIGGGDKIKEISAMEDKQKQADAYSELIWTNIFQIVKAIGDQSAWDSIGIGSDYDGGISHVDNYLNAASFDKLKENLVSYLEQTKMNKALWYDYEPKELMTKIARENSMNFFKKHFK